MKLPVHLRIRFLCLTFILFQKDRVCSQCLDHEKEALWELRNGFSQFSSHSGIATWNPDTDCCQWKGIVCDKDTNKVVSLDIGNSYIKGDGVPSTIFTLEDLERLNLANNDFNSDIPSGLDRFSKLTHLNLSKSGFKGQIPMEISRMTRLVSLDLTSSNYGYTSTTKLENSNLSTLITNLTNLKQLCLGGVNISSKVPISLNKLSSLEYLSLRDCHLLGDFPEQIFFLKNLIELDISGNPYLKVILPEFPENNVLVSLKLSGTNLSWTSAASFSNLHSLKRLEVSRCRISGPLPYWIPKLRKIVHLDMSFNNLVGDIHSLEKLTNLTHLDLSSNNFTGEITFVDHLRKLNHLFLSNNSFTGWIPKMENHSELLDVHMSKNNLSGPMPLLSSSKNVVSIILSYNCLEGKIPLSYGNLSKLFTLIVNNNLIEGPIPSSLFNHPFLSILNLNDNKLGMITTDENVNATSSRLFILYLSKNNLSGQFPNWIWNIGSSFGYKSFELEVDLSHNILEGLVVLRPNIPSFSFSIVDLSDNKLSGSIPVFAAGIDILDLSNNRFSSEISENVAANLKYARFVSVANNRIFGKIPETICDAENLYLLDLSHNKLSGSIPQCIGEKMSNLSSLILEENEFHGKMPQNYGKDCKLTTLNPNKNQLEGEIPKSLKNCKKLIYLNLGKNQFRQ